MTDKNIPVIVLDFDSTLVKVESLELLAEISLQDASATVRNRTLQRIESVTQKSMAGELDFGKALAERLSLLSIERAHINELAGRLPSLLSTSVRRNLNFFRQNAKRIVVVSGGFIDYMGPVLETCGLMRCRTYANRFLFDRAGKVTGYDKDNPLSRVGGKPELMRSLPDLKQHKDSRTVVLGDGFTDYEIRAEGLADFFCVFTENVRRPEVVASADVEVSSIEEFMEEFFHFIEQCNAPHPRITETIPGKRGNRGKRGKSGG